MTYSMKAAKTPETASEVDDMVTITAIVPAAGCGARAGLNGNKILAPLLERPVLSWTLESLCARLKTINVRLCQLIIVARPEEFPFVRSAAPRMPGGVELLLVRGGDTRQESVEAGLRASEGAYVWFTMPRGLV
jgi:2-C-methyl-D-erythritol 4-phosphate cytidylyltransferase